MLKTQSVLTGIALCLIPMTALAASAKPMHKPMHTMAGKKMAPATMYECSKCHMKYTAAQAKKDHYKDPMDGGKLVPIKSSKKAPAMGGMSM